MADNNKENKKTPLVDSTIKNFVKEVKRVNFPKATKVFKWLGITLAFLAIMAVFCFLITLGFTTIWTKLGIKS